MAIHFGNDKIKEIYVGSDKIKEVYYGSELVYTAYDPRGYWIHHTTNVKEYFDLSASFINNGIMSQPPWYRSAKVVKIPDGVTGLGVRCFRNLTGRNTSLTSITLPESVTSLGSQCFYECTSLTSINIPEGVTSLGGYCFSGCESLTSITLPESVTSIEAYCFNGCTSLNLATVLPAIPPTLGGTAFNDTHSSFNIKVRSPYVDDYKAATNWYYYAHIISAI